MINVNRATLVGRAGKDAELRYSQNGSAVMNLTVATSEVRGSGADRKEFTEWHRVVAWGKYVETLAPKIKKGTEVIVLGKVSNRSWVDKQGVKKYSTEINADTVGLTQEKGHETELSGQTDAELQTNYKQATGAPDPFDEGDWSGI